MIVFFDKLRNRRGKKCWEKFRADVDALITKKLEQLMLQHKVLAVIKSFIIVNVLWKSN